MQNKQLTPNQRNHTTEKRVTAFKSIDSLKKEYNSERKAIADYIKLRWPNGVICVKCGSDNVCTFRDGIRFKCRDCSKIFSFKVGTIFQNTKLPIKTWMVAYYLYLADSLGISSYGLAGHINVTQTTACNVLRRIRETFRQENEKHMFGLTENGIVQSDETYLKGKNKNKHGNKKIVNGQGRSKNPATVPVMGIVDRATGKVKMFKVANTNAETITPLLLKHVVKGTNVHTDEWKGYNELVKYYKHARVNHGNKEYANGDANTNCVEGVWSLLKRLVYGRYRKVSDKHTQSYLNEQVYRFNNREISVFGKFMNCFELTAVTGYKPLYQLQQGLAA